MGHREDVAVVAGAAAALSAIGGHGEPFLEHLFPYRQLDQNVDLPFFTWLAFDLVVLIVVGVATAVSGLRPYGIIAQSARQAIDVVRFRSRLALVALSLFVLQAAAPRLIVRFSTSNLWGVVAILFLVEALSIYALAHVAFRLHRGLIYGEWRQGLTWGGRERRMAIYVLCGWALVTVIGHLPIPAPPWIAPALAPLFAAALSVCAFLAKMLLALMGPAASLDDPKPLRRSISSVAHEPAGVFAVVAMMRLMLALLTLVFGLVVEMSSGVAIARWGAVGLSLVAATYVFILSEFALVIALTRTWEDHYEAETRYAAHNVTWL